MKLNKFIMSLIAGAAAAGFTACTDEVDYTAAEPVAPASVYFSTAVNNEIEIVDGMDSYDVTIYRSEAGAEQVVNISSSVSPACEGITIPSTVTFEAGKNSAPVTMSFDLDKITINLDYTITVSIEGEDVTDTPYYAKTLTFNAKYLPWTNLGKAIYRDDFIASLYRIENLQWEVEIQEHPVTKGYYRLVDPYKNFAYNHLYDDSEIHYLYINATNPKQVWIETWQQSGITLDPDLDGFYMFGSLIGNSLLQGQDIDPANFGTLENGIIKFPPKSLLIGTPVDGKGYLANAHGLFKVVLPGYEDEPEWEEVGMCNFTDGFLSPAIGETAPTYQVLVERSLVDEGFYRMVNPYGANYPFGTGSDPETPVYITIDASVPNCVNLGGDFPETGLGNETYGPFMISTAADIQLLNGATIEEVIEAELGGSLSENGVITFPGNQCMVIVENPAKPGAIMQLPAATPQNAVLDLNPVEVEETATVVPFKAGLGDMKIVKDGSKKIGLKSFKAKDMNLAR